MKYSIALSKSISNISFDFDSDDQYLFKFENVLANYLGENKQVVAVNSGTSAIHLALILAGVTQGDIVLCQSFTFSASANPIVYQKASPIFVDSESQTWNMCPYQLEKAIKKCILNEVKPKAIIAVHLYGMPLKIDQIVNIAKKYKIALIEDAAEALGSSFKGQKCGTFGDFGIISFNENKILTTFGGGALVCETEKQKQRAIFLATQAKENLPYYQHFEVGYNYRMSNVLAFIGISQMEFLDDYLLSRSNMNRFYKSVFKKIKGVSILEEPNNDYFSNHWLSCIIIDPEKAIFSKEELRLAFLKEKIESRPLWKPMHMQPVFENVDFYGTDICQNLFERGLCLPSGSNLVESDKERIKNTINKLL